MRGSRTAGAGSMLIATVFAAGMLLSIDCFAATQSQQEPAPSVDASQLGPVASQPEDTDAAQTGGDAMAPGQHAQDQQTQDEAAAQVVVPAGPQTQLPTGNATLSQLLRMWGVFGDQVGSSCAALHIGDLRCLSGQADLDMLARFNRPALLVLIRDGRSQQVLLSKLSDEQAVLAGAEGARRMDRKQLADLWTGRFEMVWRSTTGRALIRRGMRGDAVAWLQKKLALTADAKAAEDQSGSASALFGTGLEARVRHFQLMHGLEPDGLVGPRTQIMLNGLTPDAGVPTLTPQKDKDE